MVIMLIPFDSQLHLISKEQNGKTRVARRAPCKTPASRRFLKFGIGKIFGDHLLNFYHSRPSLLFRLVVNSEMYASQLTE
jgi:hypothetical protein